MRIPAPLSPHARRNYTIPFGPPPAEIMFEAIAVGPSPVKAFLNKMLQSLLRAPILLVNVRSTSLLILLLGSNMLLIMLSAKHISAICKDPCESTMICYHLILL